MASKQKLTISGRLPGLNEYTKANRANRYAGANLKKKAEQTIGECIREQKIKRCDSRVHLNFLWIEKNKRRDYDNICFAKKFILDALVKSGIIEDDNWKGVAGFVDSFGVDKESPRIEVIIEEEDDGKSGKTGLGNEEDKKSD